MLLFTALVNSCVVQLDQSIMTDLAVEKLAELQQLNCTVKKVSTVKLMKKKAIK